MKEDKILKMFFEPERWQYAISKGVDKDNSMVILFESKKEIEKCKPRLEEYIEDVKREQPTWIVDHEYLLNICLYDKVED